MKEQQCLERKERELCGWWVLFGFCVCSLFLAAVVVVVAVAAFCALTFAHGAHASTRFSHCPGYSSCCCCCCCCCYCCQWLKFLHAKLSVNQHVACSARGRGRERRWVTLSEVSLSAELGMFMFVCVCVRIAKWNCSLQWPFGTDSCSRLGKREKRGIEAYSQAL